METSAWLSLLTICVLGAISPGPSLVAVMKYTVQGSKLHGMVAALSHAVGIGLYAFLVAAGLAVVITESPQALKIMTIAGAAYLAWLGYKSMVSKGSMTPDTSRKKNSLPLYLAARDGFLIAFLNPKIAVFFLALFSQFVTPESTRITHLLMALTATLCDGIWYCLIATIAGHSSVLPTLRRNAVLVNRLCGLFLILVALRIVFI
ncbi:LysE family translocator [Endozoicomonas euniceicola]|uniref:LysE family translocator n=1 Tax=Endozoicomonas euniceicola TaxID=1234143 RepID=A0ABY6GZQ4_9GAMM|nr:LysE family translocator [Endozoicomonas euniceicola]UYM17491.1 LysE family translocator [Endozoicomonas euniceicola]